MKKMMFAAALLVAAGTAQAQWSDDFNRPDGPMGPDWTTVSGTYAIVNNMGTQTSTGVHTVLQHASASVPYADTTVKLDVIRTPGSTANTLTGVLVGLGGTDAIMVKIQAQTGTDMFSNIGIYHQLSATSWGAWTGGLPFGALTSPFRSARLTVSFPDPNTLRAELDTDFDGIADQTYISGNVLSIAPNLGTRHGITGWLTTSSFDNWQITGAGPAPCYANCDGSTTAPILNVNDFICFQTKYAAGDPTANCDNSTTQPVLNVNDFICFQTAYAAGCP